MADLSPSLVIVLAAGEGTRMKSKLAKVLHPILGTPLLGHVLGQVAGLRPEQTVVVVGHQRERVTEYLQADFPQVATAIQDAQLGTGHAVRCALQELTDEGIELGSGPVVVTAGDTPLLTAETLAALLRVHHDTGAKATVLSAEIDDPTGYGRIVRAGDGSVIGIVEHKDATDEQRSLREINSGVYAFDGPTLVDALVRIDTNNSQGEEYLTDVLGIVHNDGGRVSASVADDPEDVHGINDRVQLAAAATVLRDRTNQALMRSGVTIVDPATTWIAPGVEIGQDAVVERNTSIGPGCAVGADAVVGPDTTLMHTRVAAGASVIRSHCDRADIGAGAMVGPFTFLRPGTRLGSESRAGAYVEIKNAVVGDSSKVPHLSYVGDAEIGPRSNIGAATVFVNYDGVDKHRTEVGADVRVGSDSMLVAPVTIGDGAYTGAGSVITEDVPAGALALGRARQRNIEGWVERVRPETPAARAAAAARTAEEG
ncbi:MAG: bifunctional UDP-N-acetylglucosamine diphosphorylase/glucosamine-1-phosphate N-acetyltransferase GlmU [Actinobacteria bacterium]|nr:bifunctional UDP-N-acetylglucosamine diphosphorylase/glucosamine-1-phosphate N-acetyltransferase GlmU [Actinomycetota bacterium]